MNSIWLTVFLLTIIPILVNGLLGMRRGIFRGLVKMGAVILSAILAFLLRKVAIQSAMDAGIEQAVRDALPSDMASLADTILPLIEIMIGIVSFLALFLIINFLLHIVFMIVAHFLPRGEGKSRLFGGLGVGVATGLIFAICFVGPISGLATDAAVLIDMEIPAEGGGTEKLVKEDTLDGSLDLKAYSESGLAGFYGAIGFVYNGLATTTDKNGKEVNLSVQVDAVNSAVKMAVKVMAITDLKFENGITTENVGDVTNILRELGSIQGEMSEETKAAVTEMITSVADSFDLPEELKDTVKNFDLSVVDFNNEADLVDEVAKYQSQYEETGELDVENVDVDAMVDKLAKSELILPALSAIDNDGEPLVDLNDDQKAEVQSAIDNLPEDTDPKKIEDIKALFGMN